MATAITLVPSTAQAAPPPNDNFPGTTISGPSGSIAGTNIDATLEPDEDDDGGLHGASVWYTWTAPDSGALTLDLCDADFDMIVAIFLGDNLAETVLNDEADEGCPQPGPSRGTFAVVEGRIYRIQVATPTAS